MSPAEKVECNKKQESNKKYVYSNRTMRCRKRCATEKKRKYHTSACVLKCSNPRARTCKRSNK